MAIKICGGFHVFVAAGLFIFAAASYSPFVSFTNHRVVVRGVVLDEPTQEGVQAAVWISHVSVYERAMRGKIFIRGIERPLEYGDAITVRCFLSVGEDNLRTRLRPVAFCGKAEVIEHRAPEGFLLRRELFRVKRRVIATLSALYRAPHDAFLSALLFGSRSTLPDSLQFAMLRTGTTHIIAISGYNITLIVSALMGIGQALYVRRRIAVPVILVALALFVLFVGASASVVRAGIMGALVIVTRTFGRQGDAARALLYASTIMISFDPTVLLADHGYALSMLATAGLIWVVPIFERATGFLPNAGGLKTILIDTCAATVATLPYVAAAFGRIALVGPIVNLAIVPLVGPIMLVGFFSLALVWFFPAAIVVAWIVSVVLSILFYIVGGAAALPFASLEVLIPWYIALVAYMCIIWYVHCKQQRS